MREALPIIEPLTLGGDRPTGAFHVMAKPTGAQCNLACTYCFYLEKEALYPGGTMRMSDEVAEAYIRQVIGAAQPGGEATITWQGGEPTLIGLPFFERAVAFVERIRPKGVTVHHAIQTNGTLLDEAWAEFLKRHDVLVGISLDGPEAIHDEYRVNRGGRGTHREVLRGIRLLQGHGVAPWGSPRRRSPAARSPR